MEIYKQTKKFLDRVAVHEAESRRKEYEKEKDSVKLHNGKERKMSDEKMKEKQQQKDRHGSLLGC